MQQRGRYFALGFLLLSLPITSTLAREPTQIRPNQAQAYIGQEATVCGEVASANYASTSQGRPTFLNLGRPYPNHIFTALIWGRNRDKFKLAPEQTYNGREICVQGTIETYRRKPQIIVTEPSQITLQN